MQKTTSQGPLTGIRILDLTRLYPGPLATMMMADMGADVIKVEDVHKPDYMRSFPPFIATESAAYLAVNRSKKSFLCNFNSRAGHEIFFRLVKTADIVVEQFRPGILEKIGLGYESAKVHQPRIIYVSLTGYGQSGPYANQAGHDINYIGYAGMLGTTGTKQTPIVPSAQLADVAAGSYMTIIACLSALWARERDGHGQQVDVSMVDTSLPFMTLQMADYWAHGKTFARGDFPLSGGMANYGVYKCADDKFVALGALEQKFWYNFCDMVNKPEWKKLYAREEDNQKLQQQLRVLFATKTRDQWLALAGERDICLTSILEFEELEKNPHLMAREMFTEQQHPVCGNIKNFAVPLKFSRTPAQPGGPPPLLAADTVAILEELGYNKPQIAEFIKQDVVRDVKEGLERLE